MLRNKNFFNDYWKQKLILGYKNYPHHYKMPRQATGVTFLTSEKKSVDLNTKPYFQSQIITIEDIAQAWGNRNSWSEIYNLSV